MTQSQIKEKLLKNIRDEKIPNAICLIDKGGMGGLKLASELGLTIVTGQNQVIANSNYIHPDLHYIYPTKVPKNVNLFKKGMTSFFIDKWREFTSSHIFGSFDDWLNLMSLDNNSGSIRVGQIIEIMSILNLKAFQSEKKVCVVWGIDFLTLESANKLLKIIEEPPKKTSFFLIASDPKKIIPTIASRCQIISLPPLRMDEVKESLIKMGYDASLAIEASKVSKGSGNNGVAKINKQGVIRERERLFIECLRGCYIASKRSDFSHIIKNSNELGSLTVSDLKQLFLFGISFIRQSFLYSHGIKKLYEFKSLTNFSIENFASYVDESNYKKLISLFEINLNFLDKNANPKLLTTSFLLDLSRVLYHKN